MKLVSGHLAVYKSFQTLFNLSVFHTSTRFLPMAKKIKFACCLLACVGLIGWLTGVFTPSSAAQSNQPRIDFKRDIEP
ncbi:MAG TPA: hypothetical protein VGB07_00750, partial [Blastocatellia bacterium]